MKISSISNTNNEVKPRNVFKKHTTGLNNQLTKDSVSFGSLGGVSDVLKGGATGLFKFIEKHGFFVEFLIVDTCSMIVPRILIGLNRDKDKTGKINYKAGAEEAGREILSGPSMNLIPMGIVALVSKILPASHMEKKTLKALNHNMSKVVDKTANLTEKEPLNKELAGKLFDDAFGDFNLKNKTELKDGFVSLLNDSTKVKSKEFKTKLSEFEEHVAKINKQNIGAEPLDAKAIALTREIKDSKKIPANISAKDLFEDFRDYSKDVIEKLTKTTLTENGAGKAEGFFKKIQGSRANVKLATAVTAFLAVGSFLLYLPKIYQQGKISPAEESARRAQAEALKGGTNEN